MSEEAPKTVSSEQVPIKEKTPETASKEDLSQSSKSKPNKKIDRYGFEISDKHPVTISKKEQELLKEESLKEEERTLKWAKMFNDKDFRKLTERIMKGIPDSYRGLAWKRIIDADSTNPEIVARRPKVATLFPDLPESEWKGEYQCWHTIEVDLDRTMPDCTMFSEDQVRTSLRNILRAYSCFDKELGYTQGMGFHAAMLLSYMDEECAYYCFKKLMSDPRYNFRYYFMQGFPRLNELAKIWKVVFEDKYKKIYQKFEKDGIDALMYVPQWFLSAYMNQQFTPILRMRIFDRYISFGSRSLLSFGLVIISRHKDIFLKEGLEVIIPLLQRPCASERMADWRYLIKKWDEKWIDKKQYAKYAKKAGVEYFP